MQQLSTSSLVIGLISASLLALSDSYFSLPNKKPEPDDESPAVAVAAELPGFVAWSSFE